MMLKDPEKISRKSSDSIPARIINPQSLTNLGVDFHSLEFAHLMLKTLKCTQIVEKMHNPYSFTGDVIVRFMKAGEGGHTKTNIHVRDIDDPQIRMYVSGFFKAYIDNFISTVFPKHLHFILKNSPIFPIPFPYLEVFVKAEYGNKGNLCADFSLEGDSAEMTQI